MLYIYSSTDHVPIEKKQVGVVASNLTKRVCFVPLQRLGRRGSSHAPGVPFELLEMRQEHVDGPPRRK